MKYLFAVGVLGVCAFALTVVFGLYDALLTPEGFSGAPEDTDWVQAVLLAIGTLFGISARALFEEVQKSDTDVVAIRDSLRDAFRSRTFLTAVLVSPIVILSFYGAIDSVESHSLVSLLAFENGFFFRTVFERMAKEARQIQ